MNLAKAMLLLNLMTVSLCGCAHLHEGSYAPVRVMGQNTEARLNNVSILDRSLSRKIAIQGSGAQRTPTGTLKVWAEIRNRTDYRLQVEARVMFYDAAQRLLDEPTSWQRVYLPRRVIEIYRECSTRIHEPAFYHAEIREAR